MLRPIFISTFVLAAASAAAAPITLTTDREGFLITNPSGAQSLQGQPGQFSIVTSANGLFGRTGLMGFDLSGLPATAQVQQATLELTSLVGNVVSVLPGNPVSVNVFAGEFETILGEQPTQSNVATVFYDGVQGGVVSASFIPNTTLAAAEYWTITLRPDDGLAALFASSAQGSLGPRLTVTYSDGPVSPAVVPLPASILLLGAALIGLRLSRRA